MTSTRCMVPSRPAAACPTGVRSFVPSAALLMANELARGACRPRVANAKCAARGRRERPRPPCAALRNRSVAARPFDEAIALLKLRHPPRVLGRQGAHVVELRHLVGGELELGRLEVVLELLVGLGADDD